jgi:hypothetical protein
MNDNDNIIPLDHSSHIYRNVVAPLCDMIRRPSVLEPLKDRLAVFTATVCTSI